MFLQVLSKILEAGREMRVDCQQQSFSAGQSAVLRSACPGFLGYSATQGSLGCARMQAKPGVLPPCANRKPNNMKHSPSFSDHRHLSGLSVVSPWQCLLSTLREGPQSIQTPCGWSRASVHSPAWRGRDQSHLIPFSFTSVCVGRETTPTPEGHQGQVSFAAL